MNDFIETDRLSWFRTEHRFVNYEEVNSHQDYYRLIAKHGTSKPVYVLGNGSNCLFANRTIRSCLIKNKLAKDIQWKADGMLWASSSVPLMSVLKECHRKSLDSFYYLSSVPATVGGAIAMNAGRGRSFGKTIFDFVEEVEVLSPEGPKLFAKADISVQYRHTIFLDHPEWFIVGVLFNFPPMNVALSQNPIRERVAYSQEVQDHSGPNCGSVFKIFHGGTLDLLKGFTLFDANFSAKTRNWIVNRSKSSRGILWLIRLARLMHLLRLKRCQLEIRIIK